MPARLEWNGAQVAKAIGGEIDSRLWKCGEWVITDGQSNCPMESGTMRRAHTVTAGELPDFDEVYHAAESGRDMAKSYEGQQGHGKLFVSVNTPYARYQHDTPELHHEHGNAFWLQESISRNLPKIKTYLGVK